MLLLGTGLQFVLPSSTVLPPETQLAPRHVHEPSSLAVREYPAVLANPIFAPDRKPDETAVPVGGGMNGFSVLGIAMAPDTSTAVVRGPGGTVQRLKPGETMSGWKLVSVTLDQLTFERNNERRVLAILKGSGPLPVGAAHPAGGHLKAQSPGAMAQPDQSDDSDDDSDDDDNNQ